MLFSERVQSPSLVRGILALIFALIPSIFFYPFFTLVMDKTLSIPTTIVSVAGLALLIYAVLSLSYGVKIRVQEQTMPNGQKGLVLRLLGTNHSQRLTISTMEIDSVEEITFDESIFRSLIGSWFESAESTESTESAYVLRQLGYKGSGLAVTYSFKAPYTDTITNIVHFPVQESAVLLSLLEPTP